MRVFNLNQLEMIFIVSFFHTTPNSLLLFVKLVHYLKLFYTILFYVCNTCLPVHPLHEGHFSYL